MSKIKTCLWLAILVSVILHDLGIAQENSIGRVTALQGQATVRHRGASQDVALKIASAVFQEDVISTAAAAKIILMLANNTEVRLGEQSTLVLVQALYTPEQSSTLLKMVRGIFRVITPLVPWRGRFEVDTTTAVAAVRGTDWLGEVTDRGTAMVVQEGEVVVRSIAPAPDQAVVLTAGLGTDVPPGQVPSPPKQWGKARLQALQQATAWP